MVGTACDVIVVGGGVMGLSTALHLRLLGVKRVVILERYGVAFGQSGRAAGIVRALVRNRDVASWLMESQAFFLDFASSFSIPLQVNTLGYLLISQLSERAQVDACLALSAEAGCRASQIDVREAQELQPGLPHDAERLYAYEPGAIQVDPMIATQTLSRLVKSLGVAIVEGCEVTAISVEGGSVTGVETALGVFHAPAVLVATAVWGRNQLHQLGVEVPVYPHRAEMAFFHVPPDTNHRLSRMISDTTSMLYMRPEGPQQMFVGWREGDRIHGVDDLVREDPDNYRQTSHYASLKRMEEGLLGLLPFMRHGFAHRTYACVYDYTPDAMPILDRVEGVGGLYFALGYSGGGFSISPWVGRVMARFIHEGARPDEIALLSLERFTSGRLIDWSNIKPAGKAPVEG